MGHSGLQSSNDLMIPAFHKSPTHSNWTRIEFNPIVLTPNQLRTAFRFPNVLEWLSRPKSRSWISDLFIHQGGGLYICTVCRRSFSQIAAAAEACVQTLKSDFYQSPIG